MSDDAAEDADIPERMEFRPNRVLSRALLEEVYPERTHPGLTLQGRWERAGEEVVRQHRNGGMPPDIFQALRTAAAGQGGFLPLVLTAGGDALLQPSDGGGLRITTAEEEMNNGDSAAVMLFEELDDAELRAETSHLDSDDIIEWVLRLTSIRDDLDLARGLAATWARSDVPLADLFADALEAEYVTPAELQAAVEEATETAGD